MTLIPPRFTKRIESFACMVCKTEVTGNGYTNHCPQCLWSLHCDIFPGDRENSCMGLMEPVGFYTANSKQVITHRCTKCGAYKKNKFSKKDNFEVALRLG